MANRSRSRGKKIDYVHWHGVLGSFFTQSAGSIASLAAGALSTHPETLLRIRGEMTCWLDGTPATATAIDCAFGLLVVPGGTGTTVTSSPITDADAPWLWYERFTLANEEISADALHAPGMVSIRKVIDNKAMRIIRLDREIQLVFEQATLASAGDVNAVFNGRFLFGT